MKKTNKVVTTFEVTAAEMQENLAMYQADQLHDLVVCHLGGWNWHTISERTKFMLKLLQESEHGDWFQDLIEKHSICWVHTPHCEQGDQELYDLITNYPSIFGIGQEIEQYAHNISRGGDKFDHTDFEVLVDGTRLCSKTIWNNI